MIDYLWVIGIVALTVGLAVRLAIETRRLNQHLTARNAQKTFHMRMQLPDRLKLDLD